MATVTSCENTLLRTREYHWNRNFSNSLIIHTEIAKEIKNGPDKNDSKNGNEHVGMQKRC